MDGLGIKLYIHYNDKYDEKPRKYLGGMKILEVVRKGTLYLTLLNIVLMKVPLQLVVCDVKLKGWLSLSRTKKFLHIIRSNEYLEVAFDEYVIGVTHMVLIYVERTESYILKRKNEDGGAEPLKVAATMERSDPN